MEMNELLNEVEKGPEAEVGLAKVNTETNLTFNKFSFTDVKTTRDAMKVATFLAASDLIPSNYKNKPANVLIAMQMADNIGVDLMTCMSNLYVVQGRPSWAGQFAINVVNSHPDFGRMRFVWYHEDPSSPEKVTGCSAVVRLKETGEDIYGTKVDDKMVKEFGWDAKAGSMWNKGGFRNQMFQYRAAAYWVRANAPELLGGLYTADESRDIAGKYDDGLEERKVSFRKGE